MSSVNELKDILKDHLESKGVLDKLRTELRTEIFTALNDETSNPHKNLSKENILINDLIKEYLAFNGYLYTKSVFDTECGNPKERLSREIIATELNVVENKQTQQLPLMYSLVFGSKTPIGKMADEKVGENSAVLRYNSIFEFDNRK